MFKAAVEEALERLGDEDLTGLFTDILIEKTEEEEKPKKEQISVFFFFKSIRTVISAFTLTT